MYTRKGRPAVQDDISSLQLAFVVKHHGVDPGYRVVLAQRDTFSVDDTIKIEYIYMCSNCDCVGLRTRLFLTTFPALRMVWYLFR